MDAFPANKQGFIENFKFPNLTSMELPRSYTYLLLSFPQSLNFPKLPVQANENVPDESISESIKVEPDTYYSWDFHKCKLCHYQTKSSYAIDRHIKRHRVTKNSKLFNCLSSPLEQYRCGKCNYKTPLVVSLNKHIQVQHNGPDENSKKTIPMNMWKSVLKSYDCEKCSFKSFSQLLYVVHCRKCPVRNFLRKAHQERQFMYKRVYDRFKTHNRVFKPLTTLPKPKVKSNKTSVLNKRKSIEKNKFGGLESDEDRMSAVIPLPPAPTPKPIEEKHESIQNESFGCFDTDSDSSFFSFMDNPKIKSKPKRRPNGRFGKRPRPLYVKKLYLCKLCQFSTRYLSAYINHLKFRHRSDTTWLECGICKYRTIYPPNLLAHKSRLRHHVVLCTMCSYKTTSQKALKDHVQKEHILAESADKESPNTGTIFKCDLCVFQTKKDEELQSHILEKHISEEQVVCYKCQLCTFKTISKSELELHVMDKHVDSQHNEWFPCEMCTYKFKKRLDLKKHIFSKHIM